MTDQSVIIPKKGHDVKAHFTPMESTTHLDRAAGILFTMTERSVRPHRGILIDDDEPMARYLLWKHQPLKHCPAFLMHVMPAIVARQC